MILLRKILNFILIYAKVEEKELLWSLKMSTFIPRILLDFVAIIRAAYFTKWFSNWQQKTKDLSRVAKSMKAFRVLKLLDWLKKNIKLICSSTKFVPSNYIILIPLRSLESHGKQKQNMKHRSQEGKKINWHQLKI